MTIAELLKIERPLICPDLETTGKNPDTARIVEIGLEIWKPDGDGYSVREWRTLVNPTVPIPAEASAKHGYRDADVADARTFAELAEHLAKGMTACDFCGYNVRYDLKVLAKEFARCGIPWSYEGAAVVDGFRLWQIGVPRSLDDADKEFLTDEDRLAVGDGQSHTALFDVKRSTRVVARQLERWTNLPRTAREIHALLNPEEYDAEGKLSLRDGELYLNFGAHRDKSLTAMARCSCAPGRGHARGCTRGYLEWIRNTGDFSPKVKAACAEALRK